MKSIHKMLAACLATGVTVAVNLTAGSADAAVSPQEAEQLKTTLTPLGAERAGNKTGEIPPWTGGVPYQPELATKAYIPDLHAADKKLFSINAGNVDQYASRLAPAVIAMVKGLPDFRLDIYPTHRDAAVTPWAYGEVFKNATRATMEAHFPMNAYGGTPFPIPKTGEEILWNANYAWRGVAAEYEASGFIVPYGSSPILTSKFHNLRQFDIYKPDSDYTKWNGLVFQGVSDYFDPPPRSGEKLVIWESGTNGKLARSVWQYLVGQRRMRRAPNIEYDGTYPDCAGFAGSDEVEVWNGDTARYVYKILGKKEMYIPYDNNALFGASAKTTMLSHFVSPDYVRWELHRVWAVDFTLAPGSRHVIPHRVVYFDEDTWSPVVADEYNARGGLFRANLAYSYTQPGFPMVIIQPNTVYDLHGGGYCVLSWANHADGDRLFVKIDPKPFNAYEPETVAAEASR